VKEAVSKLLNKGTGLCIWRAFVIACEFWTVRTYDEK